MLLRVAFGFVVASAVIAASMAIVAVPARALEFALEGNGEDCVECNWIEATGPIEPGDARKLDDFMTATATHTTSLRFFSPGGELHAALELGAYLREREFDTYATDAEYLHPGAIGMVRSVQPAACYSACVYAFAGGVHRHAAAKSLGIHQFVVAYGSSDEAVNSSVMRWLDNYMTEMGVNPILVSMASDVANEAPVRLLDAPEMRALNLDNSGNWN